MASRSIIDKEAMITIPRSEYEAMKKMISDLSFQVESLQAEISLMKGSRSSRTSSTCPSQDIGRSNLINQRERSGLQSGGQKNHPGHTLEMTSTPDQVIEHGALYCTCCGNSLSQVSGEILLHRQEVDIPPIVACWKEHRRIRRSCPHCGTNNDGQFPEGLKSPVQYGAHVKAFVSYLSVSHYIPYKRIAQLLFHQFGLNLSQGSIDNILQEMSDKSDYAYKHIQKEIQKSGVLGADETGCRVNEKKHWFHVWQNKRLTFIASHATRGFKALEEYFQDGFPYSTYVSDCWAAQLKAEAKNHQLCLAHLLRELTNFKENLHCNWSSQIKDTLKDAISLKKTLTKQDYKSMPDKVIIIRDRLDRLLVEKPQNPHPKLQAFFRRMVKNKESILTFLSHPEIPPDNNGAERAIRNVKVKTKVSGQFRSPEGAMRFAKLRSVIDTTIKNEQDVFMTLIAVAEMPKNYLPE